MARTRARSPYEVEREKGPFAAILDTNVGFDLYSCVEIAEALAAGKRVGYRLRRGRAVWWLAMALDDVQLNTLSVTDEFRRVLGRRVPITSAYAPWAAVMADYVKPTVAPAWHNVASDRDHGMAGNEVDRLLVAMALEHGLPIITCEERGMVAKTAASAGVRVYTSTEFASRLELSFSDARDRFFDRFERGAIHYVARRAAQEGPFAWDRERRNCCEGQYAAALLHARREFEVIWDDSVNPRD